MKINKFVGLMENDSENFNELRKEENYKEITNEMKIDDFELLAIDNNIENEVDSISVEYGYQYNYGEFKATANIALKKGNHSVDELYQYGWAKVKSEIKKQWEIFKEFKDKKNDKR